MSLQAWLGRRNFYRAATSNCTVLRIQYRMQEIKREQSILTVEQAKKITLSGVESVDSFSDTVIHLTVCGQKVTVTGSNLKVLVFSQGSGNFAASGNVSSVKYGGKSLSKLFK